MTFYYNILKSTGIKNLLRVFRADRRFINYLRLGIFLKRIKKNGGRTNGGYHNIIPTRK